MSRHEPVGHPVPSFEDEVERFDRFCYGLVHLEPCSRDELRATVLGFARLLEAHLDAAGSTAQGPTAARPGAGATVRVLEREHQQLRGSVAELRGLLGVIETDDHGGHRQALGQYGRLLAEALRPHCHDEAPAGRSPKRAVAPSKHN